MNSAFRILFSSRRTLLAAEDLASLCKTAVRLRRRCALMTVAVFLAALGVVLGHALLPVYLIFPALGGLLAAFIICAALASRFGRLTGFDGNQEYESNRAHLARINPQCAEYDAQIREKDRPFTRLDLDELGSIHLQTRKEQQ